MRGIPVGKNAVTNFRGLPAVSYHEMYDFDLQQEVCAKAGITGRIISTPFAAEGISWASKKPAIDIVKSINDQIAGIVARSPRNWGLGTLNPLDASHIAEGERCLDVARLQGAADLFELARPLPRRRRCVRVLGVGRGPAGADLHPSAARADRARAADGSVQARRTDRPAVRHRDGAGAHDPLGPVRPLSAAEDRGGAHGRRAAAVHGPARFRLPARLRGHAGARGDPLQETAERAISRCSASTPWGSGRRTCARRSRCSAPTA